MDELQMVRELLPAQPPPRAEVTAAARSRLWQIKPAEPRARRMRLLRYGLGLPLAAGVAAVSLLLASFGGAPVGGSRVGGRPPTARSATPGGTVTTLSARAILLAASASAARGTRTLTTGRYWHIRTVSMELRPFGSVANPYNMAFQSSHDEWNARAARQRSVWADQELGAQPAAVADAAAWRSAGSPHAWINGVGLSDTGMPAYLYATAAAGKPFIYAQDMNGNVGDAVGDATWLNTAQFATFPSDPAKLKALMIHYVLQDYTGVGYVMPPMNTSLMGEALNLLADPLSPQVESAVYRVMADLPGVRSLGAMRDPMGRSGYGIAIGDPALVQDSTLGGPVKIGAPISKAAGEAVAIIDPSTGKLLATEVLVTAPARTRTHSSLPAFGLIKKGHGPWVLVTLGHPGDPGSPARWCKGQYTTQLACHLPAYYGTRYQGQVWQYTALVSAGWTNASP